MRIEIAKGAVVSSLERGNYIVPVSVVAVVLEHDTRINAYLVTLRTVAGTDASYYVREKDARVVADAAKPEAKAEPVSYACAVCEDASGKVVPATWVSSETETYACDEHGPFFLADMTPDEGVLPETWTRLDGANPEHKRSEAVRARLEKLIAEYDAYEKIADGEDIRREYADCRESFEVVAYRRRLSRESIMREVDELTQQAVWLKGRAEEYKGLGTVVRELNRRRTAVEDAVQALKSVAKLYDVALA